MKKSWGPTGNCTSPARRGPRLTASLKKLLLLHGLSEGVSRSVPVCLCWLGCHPLSVSVYSFLTLHPRLLCVSVSPSMPLCVSVHVRVCMRTFICLSACISLCSPSSLSLILHLFLPLCLLTPGLPSFLWPWPLTGAMTLVLADELASAGCLTWRG